MQRRQAIWLGLAGGCTVAGGLAFADDRRVLFRARQSITDAGPVRQA